MKKTLIILICLVVLIGIGTGYFLKTSPSPDLLKREYIQYSAFQYEDGGRWGLVNLRGEIIADKAFDRLPTAVTEDHFFVMDDDSLYALYTIRPEVRQVSRQRYRQVGFFSDSLCPVILSDGIIGYIGYDGNPAFQLEKLAGAVVKSASVFADGRALVVTDKGVGFIDTRGNLVSHALYFGASGYSEGKAIVIEMEQRHLHPADRVETVIDVNGDVLFKLPRFTHPTDKYRNGWIVARIRTRPGCFFLYDAEGNESVLDCDAFNPIGGDVVSYAIRFQRNDDASIYYKWGLMKTNGDLVTDPIYNYISDNGVLFVAIDKDGKNWLLNKKGKKVSALDAASVIVHREAFEGYKNSLMFIDDQGYAQFADAKGQPVSPLRIRHYEMKLYEQVEVE